MEGKEKIKRFNAEVSDLKCNEQLFCGNCARYSICKDLLERDAPACKIYK